MKEIYFFQMREENIHRNGKKSHTIRKFLLFSICDHKDGIYSNTYSFIGVQQCQKGNKEQANAPPKFVIFL